MRKVLFLTTVLVFVFSSQIWAADISGTWVLKYTGSQGDERAMDMVIKAAGQNLTITTTHPSLGEMAGTGKLAGNDITMTITATGEREIGFELKGTVTGNKMAGTREVVMPEGGQDEGSGRSGGDRPSRDSGDSSGRSGDGPPGGESGGARGGESGGARGGESGGARGGESGGARGGESGGARGGESGDAPRQAASTTWTAEKK